MKKIGMGWYLLISAYALLAPARNTAQRPVVLELKVSHYKVDRVDMEAALRALRATDPIHILFGFERVAVVPEENQARISLDLNDTTVEAVLDGLCRQDARYSYAVIEKQLIHVFPRSGLAQSDPAGLLSIRNDSFSINENVSPSNIIDRISVLAPGLSSFLAQKRASVVANQKGELPGSPGALMHGNMDPLVRLQLRNVTVFDILNEVVLYSAKMNRETPADWTGNKPIPTSWIYEFDLQPNSKTGLGGVRCGNHSKCVEATDQSCRSPSMRNLCSSMPRWDRG